ncbi:hypothetical protein [Demequina mangrovi]|uniref:Uncharacterized protein n=1 Tax=Demequina mangrovi TaxID=1043493 RepID=A0A1H6Z6I4_9MICO|nr:hypothetical protein [Demequina mangrovi]SEJ45242.1 hypothetical protein SAMN05421637_1819 [Demequina mangrovi]
MPSTLLADRPLADVLADARARLGLPALLTAAPGGLAAWCLAPEPDASPLPALARRIERRGFSTAWPVGLLAPEPLAADLAARGLTYRHGLGYAIHGSPVEPSQAARLAAEILDDAAEILAAPASASASLWRDPATPAEGLYLAKRLDSLLARLPLDLAAHADALAHTARDLRTSRGAQTAALALVRPYLPDGRPVVDADAVGAFLAAYDDAEAIARPDLGRAYADAGTPGALADLPTLYALAAERWGAPVKRRGTITFRPAPLTDRRPALRLTR